MLNRVSVCFLGGVAALVSTVASAELSMISEQEMSHVSGQGGIYLTGDISFNESGGPMEQVTAANGVEYYGGDCSQDVQRRCGARLAYQTRQNGGWFVFDNIQGGFSFQGLTLRVRHIDSGFGGDGAAFDRDVLEIGLPEFINFDNVRMTFATANAARPTDLSYDGSAFQQTDIISFEMDGNVTMQGNLLVFPTGNP
ncbi:hypothetical protein OLMES_0664 [Oleiphilus messinensis]|uniref:Uncharacterized protein n=1 Tax=Oleiphilus messinensis TaxID=141451 RepID=A0A1Y0I2X0_9GAMM|nr:hypothetical protein [Oleiphilus messinensis]ARU54761.1 hypothetical protein OLMES_0664 [Oleiphilus messinensis]